MQSGSSSARQRELYRLASGQAGYFTAKQAAALGYRSNARVHHVRAGNWIREYRGIYRLALYPEPERPDLMLWWLWSRDRTDQPTGVFSHVTALSLYDLTDANPATVHLTVPPGFRRGAPIPKVLHLHFADVPPSEKETIQGVPVTSPLRSILEVWRDRSMPADALSAAFHQAVDSGRITQRQIRRAVDSAEWRDALTGLQAAAR